MITLNKQDKSVSDKLKEGWRFSRWIYHGENNDKFALVERRNKHGTEYLEIDEDGDAH